MRSSKQVQPKNQSSQKNALTHSPTPVGWGSRLHARPDGADGAHRGERPKIRDKTEALGTVSREPKKPKTQDSLEVGASKAPKAQTLPSRPGVPAVPAVRAAEKKKDEPHQASCAQDSSTRVRASSSLSALSSLNKRAKLSEKGPDRSKETRGGSRLALNAAKKLLASAKVQPRRTAIERYANWYHCDQDLLSELSIHFFTAAWRCVLYLVIRSLNF